MKKSEKLTRDDFFGNAAFDIEHALSMYALSFCTIPAAGLYDKEALAQYASVLDTCHIYMIGYTPRIDFVGAEQKDRNLLLSFKVLSENHVVEYVLPEGASLGTEGDLFYVGDSSGKRFWPNEMDMQTRLAATGAVKFEVKYVGQAYGQGGSRNAIDRLLKHETLQKIALKTAPDGYQITLLLLAIEPNNQLVTVINPRAKNKDESGTRIRQGLDKLFNTTEEERISLYEAALIRYFYPDFNKEFKDSFPSTNLKILRDCYEKDFSAVVAEICIDGLPFRLWSNAVGPKLYHIAKHDLHKSEERRMFFGL
ncbi:hypothetical protein [Acidovorax sp. Leaf78]|uniref:hypothetical protein n=1 Tax=Acidovorax sp. Leaf78 TaxID=1736237 RepID=UPI00070003CE|nr:hypothetical protein [Acidovorax sp. Leaf78]KQO20826.1 hypothetical protein ASF16_25040 [Acidovorax sp. Leaf78]